MGNVVEGIVDGIVNIAEGIWNGITGLAEELWSVVWDEILNPILEPIVGLFGLTDETVVQVQVTTQRYFPDEPKFVPTLIRNILTSVNERTDMMDEVRIGLLNNGVVSGRKYYNYGKLGESRIAGSDVGDGYVFGVPTIVKTYGTSNTDELTTVLLSFHTDSTSLVYNLYRYGKIDDSPNADPWKYWTYFYFEENDATWDQSAKTIEAHETLTYQYTQYNETTEVWEAIFTDSVPDNYAYTIPDPTDYNNQNIVAIYTITGGTDDGKQFIWIYDATSGDYPALEQDIPDTNPSVGFQFMPVVPLKANGDYLDAAPTSQEYLTSRLMLDYIGIGVDSLIAAVAENPDEAQVTDAFIHFGANLYDDSQPVNKYLFAFFTSIANETNVSKASYNADIANPAVEYAPYNAIAILEENFNLAMQFNYIDIENLSGNVGSIGWVNKTINYTGTKVKFHTTDTVVFTVQDSVNTYTRMTVKGLNLIHLVKTSIGQAKTKAIGIVDPTSTTAEDVRAQKNFVIPVSMATLNYYGSLPDKEILLYRSICFTVYSEQITYLEWYETEAFATFLQIVIIIVSIATMDPTKLTWTELIKKVLIQIALQVTLEAVLRATDSDLIKALAYLAYAYGSMKNWGQDPFALGDPAVALKWVDATGKAYLQIETDDLLAEVEDFQQLKEEAEAELDRVSDLIDMPSGIADVMTWIQTDRILHYEAPDQFFTRTLDTNPGVKTLSTINTFFDRMLKLPELDPRLDVNRIVFMEDQETVTT